MMSRKLILLGMGGALLLALTAGCSSEPAAEKNQAPARIAMPPAMASNLALPLSGTVAELFENGGYSFLRLETTGGEHWVATSSSGFQEGETISVLDGQLMQDFYSRSLDRTFPEIIFASSLSGGKKEQAVLQAPSDESAPSSFAAALRSEPFQGESSSGMGGMSGAGMGRAPADIPLTDIKVEKATGDNAFRVAELHQQAGALNGKEVTVKGQVMKISTQIMGRNWIHLQDGSGDTSKDTHNLVVTTDAMPEKGAIVTIKGIFQADKDIGSGYRYAALVEQAKIVE
jgi:hypothetical protein